MDLGIISVRYAKALYDSAAMTKTEEQVYKDMCTLAQCYAEVPQLRSAVENPMLADDTKLKLLECACGPRATELTKRFIALVLKEDREYACQFMANSYITFYRKQKNIIHGKLTTASAVDSNTERKMQQMVASRTNATVEFQTSIDSTIMGGFVLDYDTYRLDMSVKRQLNDILHKLCKDTK